MKHIGVPALGRVTRISNHLQELGHKRYACLGLTIMRHDILINLLIQGEPFQMSPKALSEATFMTSGGTSNALEHLEQEGLVTREPDPNDRRGVLVTLTAEGHRFISDVQPEIAAIQHSVVEVLDESEMQLLDSLLRKLLLSLEERVAT